MTISQALAPCDIVPGGGADPSLLAMMLFEKKGRALQLIRQAKRDALNGADFSFFEFG